jgi:hypothetical protein
MDGTLSTDSVRRQSEGSRLIPEEWSVLFITASIPLPALNAFESACRPVVFVRRWRDSPVFHLRLFSLCVWLYKSVLG